MRICDVTLNDVPKWISLSKEYDRYVMELVPNLTEWYEGNKSSVSFDKYMKAKISQNEAFMAVDDYDRFCGIIAISRKNNNITFFGISHNCNFNEVGTLLLNHVLWQLNLNSDISINVIKSEVNHIYKEFNLLIKNGFVHCYDDLENGVPVNVLIKNPV